MPFYILIPVLAYALWYGLQPATVIAPFHLPPENKEHPLPFSGEAVADAVQDAIMSIRQEAEGQPLTPPCDFLAANEGKFGGLKAKPSSSFEVRGPVSVEVKGISPGAVASAAREALGTERYISGDVILSGANLFQLMVRANDRGPWMTKPKEISLDGLKYASCELAERILGATNKNVLAAAWIRREKYDGVIELYGHLPSKGGDPDALNNLGVALRMKCQTTDGVASSKQECKIQAAAARFRQALASRWWGFPEAHYNLGGALDDNTKYDEAIPEYRKAIKLKPDYAEAYFGLGKVFYDKKWYPEAIAEYRKAIELKPEFAMAHNNLGLALQHTGEYDEAVVEWHKAIELKPDFAEAHNNLGTALDDAKRYDEAIVEYHKAIELKPDDADVHNNLGVALRHKGDNDAGIAEYRKAIDGYLKILAAKPDDAEAHTGLAYAHNNLGVALLDKGQTDEAIAEYRKAIELKPDYALARNNLAKALARKGQ